MENRKLENVGKNRTEKQISIALEGLGFSFVKKNKNKRGQERMSHLRARLTKVVLSNLAAGVCTSG